MSEPARLPPSARLGFLTRVHHTLMPDYNRRTAVYWWALALVGAAALVHALSVLAGTDGDILLRIGVGCAAVALAALFPIRVPRTTITFAAGEAFIFLVLLLYGQAAATFAAACEAAVGSTRSSRRWTSRIASPATAAISMTAIGVAFDRALASAGPEHSGITLFAVSLFAAAYGLLAALLVSLVPLLKRDGPVAWRALVEAAGTFGGIAAMHAGSALLGALLYLAGRQYGEGFMLQGVVIVTLVLTAVHFYLQHQAAEGAARSALLEASEVALQEAMRHAEELADSRALFRGSFVDAGIAMALLASDGSIRQANAAACELLGSPLDRIVGSPFVDIVDDSLESATLRSQLSAPLALAAQTLSGEFFVRRAEGRRLRVLLRCSPLKRNPGIEPCLIVQLQDITAQHLAEADLRRMAYEDVLTGLPNRRWLLDYLNLLATADPATERGRHALVLIDLDRFKFVNDALGHAYGDQFLRLLAERIRAQLSPSDQLARLGGDEFGAVLLAVPNSSAAQETARRLAAAIAQPLRLGGEVFHPSASIGVALGGKVPTQDLLRQADAALYRVKDKGGNGVSVFDSHHEHAATLRLRRETELRDALATNLVHVVYQPICSTAGAVVGFEALARWTRPSGEVVEPQDFIGLADEIGLIPSLTDLVLGQACRQFKHWLDMNPVLAAARLHVNVGGDDLACGTLVARVERALAAAALHPRQLAIEITEDISTRQLDAALRTLQRLSEIGVQICIDDFGAGRSSLSWMATLPVGCLKIDRALIRSICSGVQEGAMVRAVVALGRALQMEVVAEGVETQAQWDCLVAMGCGFAQGNLIAQPLAAQDVVIPPPGVKQAVGP